MRLQVLDASRLPVFSELESAIAQKWRNPDRIAGQIRKKENIANVIFGDKDTQHCERAASAMAGWAGLRNWQGSQQGHKKIVTNLMAILRFLNVPLGESADRKRTLTVQNDIDEIGKGSIKMYKTNNNANSSISPQPDER